LDLTDEAVSESDSGAELGEGVSWEETGLDVGIANDRGSLVAADAKFDEGSVFEATLHGTTTRSFTASKAAERHKSRKTSYQV
jgi:hypothetical protein